MAPLEPELSRTLRTLSARPMSRREFVSQGAKLSLSASAVGSLLAACESNTASTTKSVTLRLVTFEGVQKPNIQHAAALFSKQYPNVKVVTEFVPFTSTRDKMAIELASGKGGLDFLFIIDDWVPEFIQSGWLEPLDSYISKDPPANWPGDWGDYALITIRQGGHTYGFPNHGGPIGLMYRKDLIADPVKQQAFTARFGYQMPDPPSWTWADFQNVGLLYTDPSKRFYGTAWGSKQGEQQLAYDFMTGLWSRGGKVFKGEDATGKISDTTPAFNDQAGVDTAVYYANSINKVKFADPASTSYGTFEAALSLMNGGVFMVVNWLPFGPTFEGSKDSKVVGKLGYTMIPKGTGSAGRHSAGNAWWYYGIASSSKNKDWAYRFIKFLTEPAQQEDLLQSGGQPMRLSLLKRPDLNAKFPFLEPSIKVAEAGNFWPHVRQYAQLDSAIQEAMSEVVAGSMSAQAALDGAASKVAAIMKA